MTEGSHPALTRLADASCQMVDRAGSHYQPRLILLPDSDQHDTNARPQQACIQSNAKGSTASQTTPLPMLWQASGRVQR